LFYIVRNGSVIKPGCMTFSDFMRFGYGGYEANIDDWVLHLSTLYPEARLKNVIELRSADTCSPAYAAALAAFWRGLFYSDQALERSQHLLNFIDYSYLDRLYMDAARVGLAANVAGKYKVASVARELIETSRMGLVDLRACEAELAYLDVFLEVVNGG
jgi:glutamate--cysteine ligase